MFLYLGRLPCQVSTRAYLHGHSEDSIFQIQFIIQLTTSSGAVLCFTFYWHRSSIIDSSWLCCNRTSFSYNFRPKFFVSSYIIMSLVGVWKEVITHNSIDVRGLAAILWHKSSSNYLASILTVPKKVNPSCKKSSLYPFINLLLDGLICRPLPYLL